MCVAGIGSGGGPSICIQLSSSIGIALGGLDLECAPSTQFVFLLCAFAWQSLRRWPVGPQKISFLCLYVSLLSSLVSNGLPPQWSPQHGTHRGPAPHVHHNRDSPEQMYLPHTRQKHEPRGGIVRSVAHPQDWRVRRLAVSYAQRVKQELARRPEPDDKLTHDS